MKQRDAYLALGAVIIAVGISAILLAGAFASASGGTTRQRVFFDPRFSPRPAADVVEVQRRFPEPFGAIVPVQREVSEAASDAAGYLLSLLATATALVLGHDQVLAAYRASLGTWRTQLRVFLTGVAVLGVTASALALASIVFLGSFAVGVRGGPFGVPGAIQMGIGAFSVAAVVLGILVVLGFSASAWRLGDLLFAAPGFRRAAPAIPSPLVALVGATIIYIASQLPVVGGIAAIVTLAYSLGAVVTARLAQTTSTARPSTSS